METKGVFLRKATGLVREAGLVDVLTLNIFNMSVGFTVMYITMWGPISYPGGDLVTGTILCSIIGIILALGWAILGISVPRSGGVYVPVSRILHPVLGFAAGVSLFLLNFIWVGSFAAYVADPCLTTYFHLIGWEDLANFIATPEGMILIGTVANILGLLVIIRGTRPYLRFQTIMNLFAIATGFLVVAILFSAGHSGFVARFDEVSAKWGSPSYQQIIDIAQTDMGGFPAFNLQATLGIMPVAFWGFGFAYMASFIAGEIKEYRRNILWGQIGSVLLTVALVVLMVQAISSVMGYDFLLSVVYVWDGGLGYNLPFEPNYIALTSMLTDNPILVFTMILGLIWWAFGFIPLILLENSRMALAWAFDRLVPSWLADVDDRLHTPVKGLLFLTVIGEIGVVVYAYYIGFLGTLSTTIGEALTNMLFMAIAVMLFPVLARVGYIWKQSPLNRWGWKCSAVGAACIAGLAIVVYYFMTNEGLGEWQMPSLLLSLGVFLSGVVWFAGAYYYRRRQQIDIMLAYKLLPPE
jgi:amino acid transporter